MADQRVEGRPPVGSLLALRALRATSVSRAASTLFRPPVSPGFVPYAHKRLNGWHRRFRDFGPGKAKRWRQPATTVLPPFWSNVEMCELSELSPGQRLRKPQTAEKEPPGLKPGICVTDRFLRVKNPLPRTKSPGLAPDGCCCVCRNVRTKRTKRTKSVKVGLTSIGASVVRKICAIGAISGAEHAWYPLLRGCRTVQSRISSAWPRSLQKSAKKAQ
jgi:hypothetical protein